MLAADEYVAGHAATAEWAASAATAGHAAAVEGREHCNRSAERCRRPRPQRSHRSITGRCNAQHEWHSMSGTAQHEWHNMSGTVRVAPHNMSGTA